MCDIIAEVCRIGKGDKLHGTIKHEIMNVPLPVGEAFPEGLIGLESNEAMG